MKHDFKLEINEYLPLRDVVFQTLRKAILTGELKPGERLMEIHLANQLGVSRTPVREAIRNLEQEGLVITIPRRGAEVAQITASDMQDMLEVRCALDVLCAELACLRITDEQISSLKVCAKDFEEACRGKDLTHIAECDVAFHDIILSATGNKKLITLVHNLSEPIYRYRFEYIKDSGDCSELIKEHHAICEAIESKDTSRAVEATRLHIANQQKAIMSQINV